MEVNKSRDIQLKERIIVLGIVGIRRRKERRRENHESNRSGDSNRGKIGRGNCNTWKTEKVYWQWTSNRKSDSEPTK